MDKETIKQQYSMRDVLSRYGMVPNRAGFINCPFHPKDRTASMKIYKTAIIVSVVVQQVTYLHSSRTWIIAILRQLLPYLGGLTRNQTSLPEWQYITTKSRWK